jgi:hypothetical protein
LIEVLPDIEISQHCRRRIEYRFRQQHRALGPKSSLAELHRAYPLGSQPAHQPEPHVPKQRHLPHPRHASLFPSLRNTDLPTSFWPEEKGGGAVRKRNSLVSQPETRCVAASVHLSRSQRQCTEPLRRCGRVMCGRGGTCIWAVRGRRADSTGHTPSPRSCPLPQHTTHVHMDTGRQAGRQIHPGMHARSRMCSR